MRVGVLGINHKLADLKLRELLAKACHRRFGSETFIHNTHDFILLSTCNRTEVYFCSDDLAATHSYLLGILRNDVSEEFDQKLYSYFGRDCFLHLCRVTAGLDSAIVAETEIQGQVKNAYEHALKYNTLPYELHYLFQKSLGIAKKVRSVLPMKPGLPDIEHAIYQTGQHLFEMPQQAKILFIGASDINQKILEFLKNKNMPGISLCNRTMEKGRTIAEKYGVPLVSWDELDRWHTYDWIILGTKATDHLISHKHIPASCISHKLVIDLSVPRNVDPQLSLHPQITLLNIDQINRRLKIRRKKMNLSLTHAEELVTQAISQHIKIFQDKESHRLRLYGVA